MEWYYAKKKEQRGPVSGSTLRSMIISGEVAGTDLVWRKGMQDWTPAAEIRDFESNSGAEVDSAGSPEGSSGSPSKVVQPLDYTDPSQFFPDPPVSVRAKVSLVCGIAGVMLSCIPIVPVLPSIAAVVLGNRARSEKALDPGQPKRGDGVALAGVILGYIGILLAVVFSCLFLFIGMSE